MDVLLFDCVSLETKFVQSDFAGRAIVGVGFSPSDIRRPSFILGYYRPIGNETFFSGEFEPFGDLEDVCRIDFSQSSFESQAKWATWMLPVP
jgi:hypothetical protein